MTQEIKILFYSDTHLGFDYPVRPRIERRRRGEDFFANHYRALEYAIEKKVDLVIHGGDLFFRTRIPKSIVDKVYAGLLEFTEHGIPLVIIPGNHESSRLPTSILIQHPGIHIFKNPQLFAFDIKGVRLAVAGFPYIKHNVRDRFGEAVKEASDGVLSADIRLLCIHEVVEGSKVGPGNFTFRRGEHVIRFKDLPDKFHAILSGHIHRVQVLYKERANGDGSVPLIYPGSVERTSFAEKDEEKGFFILKFQPERGGWILKPPRFVKLPTRPMVDVKIGLKTMDANKLKTEIAKSISGLDRNAIVRIEIPDAQTRSMVTSRLLREVIPHTMNVQFKGWWKGKE